MVDTVGLLLGRAVLRPYVFVFFIVYLLLAAADLGRRRALIWWIGELGLLGMGILLHTAAYLSPRCLPGVRAALAGTWTTALSERGEARRP